MKSQFGPAYAALAPQMSIHVLPVFTLNGIHNFYNFGNITGYSVNWWNTYGTNANLIKIIGAHSLKFGTELRLMDQSGTGFDGVGLGTVHLQYDVYRRRMGFILDGLSHSGPVRNVQQDTASYNYYQAYYVTDTWQAKRNLTLNLGLRYELPGAVAERNNKATVLLPNAVDPYTGVTGTLTLVNSASLFPQKHCPSKTQFVCAAFGLCLAPEQRYCNPRRIRHFLLAADLTGVLASSSLVNAASTQINVTGALPTSLQNLYPETLNQPIGRTDPSFMTLYCCTASLKNIIGPVPQQNFPIHARVELHREPPI